VDAEQYDTTAVQALLPHRYPFLLVDRIDVVERAKRVVGLKQVSAGEWWADGSATAVMPFGLVLEALAQTSGALVQDLAAGMQGAVAYFMGADRVRMRRPPRVGDELTLDVSLRLWRRGLCRTHGIATIGGAIVLTADLTTIIRSGT
jgi:3-hydroxyacyl-[acyl-carrier-protein] dehydratase